MQVLELNTFPGLSAYQHKLPTRDWTDGPHFTLYLLLYLCFSVCNAKPFRNFTHIFLLHLGKGKIVCFC